MRGVLQGLDSAVIEAMSRKNTAEVTKMGEDRNQTKSKFNIPSPTPTAMTPNLNNLF